MKPDKKELEFWPAALEIVERPVSPLARVTIYSILGFLLLALTWSIFGKVDIVVTAPGRLVPEGAVKRVQTKELSKVVEIGVVEGQFVTKGQTLFVLDSSEIKHQIRDQYAELAETRLSLARTRAESEVISGNKSRFDPQTTASIAIKRSATRQFNSNVDFYAANLKKYRAQSEAKKAEALEIEAKIHKMQRLLPFAQEQEEAERTLLNRGTSSRRSWSKSKEQLISLLQDIEVETRRLERARLEVSQLEAQIIEWRQTAKRQLAQEASTHAKELRRLESAVFLLEKRARDTVIRAPITGYVQGLKIQSLGQVTNPGDDLLFIIPKDSTLDLEAMVSNRDIATLRTGHEVVIKIESYPFTTHGTLTGRVSSISKDAISNDAGLLFPIKVELLGNKSSYGEGLILSSGMTASAEILAGKRRIISFFIDPVTKHLGESLRER